MPLVPAPAAPAASAVRDPRDSFARVRTLFRWMVIGGLVAGCKSEIGDQCVLSTDCSTRGDRLCDTSQPGGYCTQFNCSTNSCPDNALCVLFNSNVPGCGYDDRAGKYGSRIARAFCVASCDTNEDCRGGYACVDPKLPPWNGLVQDTNQVKRSCMVLPTDYNLDGGVDAAGRDTRNRPICGPTAPDVDPIDASPPRIVNEPTVNPPLVSDAGVDAADAGDGGDDGGDGGDGG